MLPKGSTWHVISAGLIVGVTFGYIFAFHPDKLPNLDSISPTAWGLNPWCRIKGNVSINSRERIYHVPGQRDYVSTVIDRRYGERWFCTEDEARAAGWRKAGR